MPTTKIMFWLSGLLIFYVYLGYPLLAYALGRLTNRRVRCASITPKVSIVIAAYNEEQHIEETLLNKLALDYPREEMEIIVVSDASDDQTDEIVRNYESMGVRLLRQEPRCGKTAALNRAVSEASGDIIVFSDANSLYDRGALRLLVRSFNDPDVGYVTGKMIYTNPDGSPVGDGCSAYMKYENFLRSAETSLGSVVGVDGGIDAVRKSLYRPMNYDQLPDFVLPLKVVSQGFRVVFEPEALLKEAALGVERDEYRMRVRVTLRALWALFDVWEVLSIKRFGVFSWQVWSHKALRYASFSFLLIAWLANLLLWNEGRFYQLTMALQSFLYASAIVPLHFYRARFLFALSNLWRYFLLVNLASAHAFLKFILGRKQVLWTPRKG